MPEGRKLVKRVVYKGHVGGEDQEGLRESNRASGVKRSPFARPVWTCTGELCLEYSPFWQLLEGEQSIRPVHGAAILCIVLKWHNNARKKV